MAVTAETPEEKAHVIEHFRLGDDALKAAQIITNPEPFTHVCPMVGRDNAAWFECTGALEIEFSEPYFKEYVQRTGDAGGGILPDLDLTASYPWQGLHHTHYLRELYTDGGHICFTVIIRAGDWNGQDAATLADRRAVDYMQEAVGERPFEREYIETHNGLLKRNPNYLKRHKARPALSAQWLFSALIDNWLATKAAPKQRELAETDRALMFANHRGAGGLRELREYQGLRRNWQDAAINWMEFKELGIHSEKDLEFAVND